MEHSVFITKRDSLASVLLGLLPSNVRRSVSSQSSYPRSAAGIPRPPSAGSIFPPPRVLRCNRVLRRLRSSLRFWLQSWPFSFTPVKSSLSLSRQPSFDRRRTAGLSPFLPRFPRFSCLRKPHPLLALLLLAAALVSLWDVEFVVEIGDDRTRAASGTIGGEHLRRRGRESWGAEEIFTGEGLRHPTSWSSASSSHASLRSSLLYPSLRLDEGNRAAPMRGRLLGLAAQSLVAVSVRGGEGGGGGKVVGKGGKPPEAQQSSGSASRGNCGRSLQRRTSGNEHSPSSPLTPSVSPFLPPTPILPHQKQWQREPPDLWEEPPEALQWRPCALGDSSLSAPSGTAATHSASRSPTRGAGSDGTAAAGGSSGSSSSDSSGGKREDAGPFFSVAAKGGLSQLRVAVSVCLPACHLLASPFIHPTPL
ncbi:unnamed protein product [Closterium sp. Naga37s-1]|nr:unnamed protein product [Closterium sp. Naga37s-1]